jgi:anti-anti-sigma factor
MTIPFDINIFIYYLILEEFHGVLEMGFMQEEHGSILVEVVDLDRATLIDVEEFKKLLFQDIQTGWRKIIIDISQCEFIDSTFLGMIVVALKKISELGGKLRLVGIQPEVQTMFQLTRMNRIFEIFENREDALQSYM